jgi:hypothetical protein
VMSAASIGLALIAPRRAILLCSRVYGRRG